MLHPKVDVATDDPVVFTTVPSSLFPSTSQADMHTMIFVGENRTYLNIKQSAGRVLDTVE